MSNTESYQWLDWPAPEGVKAVFTTRLGGVSKESYSSFNLATHVGDEKSLVLHNRQKLMDDLAISRVCWLNQVHETAVFDTSDYQPDGPMPIADACYTNSSGLACAIMVADCMPVVVADKKGRKVGAAHAGWRGLCAGIIPALLNRMNISREDCLVWLGPCIGPDSFEVGPDVLTAFKQSGNFLNLDVKSAFVTGEGDRYFANLALLAKMQLAQMGITNIYQSTDCTYTQDSKYYSYRREGNTGRMAALIWMS